jgi:DNA-binding winged helix-turn-helix (wHTH) protein/tetratricopeptide (TPR) repeat protein
MTSIPPDDVVRFDRFALDRRQRVLLREGEIVRLTPKAFELLELLVSRANEVVSKSDLVDRVWPDTFVSETNLSKLVFTIRKELGDGPDGRAYIETIPKRGYRFVSDHSGQPAADAPQDVSPAPARWKRSARVITGAALAAAVVAAAVLGWWKWKMAVRPERTYLVIMPFHAVSGGDEPLARGISEFVTARLSAIHGVSVLPAVMAGAGANPDPRKLGRQLGAGLVLQGTVQRTGDRIGVVCAVVPVNDKTQMGAGNFIVASSDIFEIEEQVAGGVASLLEIDQSVRHIRDRALATPERQQAYVRALGLMSRFNHEARIDDAVALLEPLAAPNVPKSPLVLAALGRAHLLRFDLYKDRKDLDLAQSFADRASALDHDNARVRALRGAIASDRGDFPRAVAELESALKLEPDANDILLNLAGVYSHTSRPGKAEETYQRIIRAHPLCAVCYDAFGLFYKKAGRLEESVAQYSRAIALDPESGNFHSDLAVSLLFLGRFREAVTGFEKAATISRDNEVISNLGYAEYLVGDLEAASQHFAEATTKAPNDYLAWGNLGDALRLIPSRKADADHAFDRAITLARQELQLNAKDAVVRAHLGEYFAKRGDTGSADQAIGMALAAGPSHPDVSDILFSAACAAAALGRKTEAVDYLERSAKAGMSPTVFTADPQFSSLRTEAKFRAMGSPHPAALTAAR